MPKIMVVDDELLLRSVLKDSLEEAGHTVVLAEDGQAALACAKAESPDCILLDIMMPGLDGYETCAALKANPQLAAIPVILISATTDLRVIDRAEQVGATTVLPKPVPIEQLEQALILALNPPKL
jgi:twitching motility two-component system response regulator PilG